MLKNKTEDKKVLLCERKRYTARRVASTRYAALSNPDLVGGVSGVPPNHHPDLVRRGVPHPYQVGGVPHPDLVRGVPPHHPDLGLGTPPDLRWVPPQPGMGYPYPDLRWGTPHLDLGWGTP